MRKVIILFAIFVTMMAYSQTYTNEYPKELTKFAQKWVKKGS